eukprot:365355-Chlamydomonas_euryale.AAC.7
MFCLCACPCLLLARPCPSPPPHLHTPSSLSPATDKQAATARSTTLVHPLAASEPLGGAGGVDWRAADVAEHAPTDDCLQPGTRHHGRSRMVLDSSKFTRTRDAGVGCEQCGRMCCAAQEG